MIQTGFEARGHLAPWTSFAEESAYITQFLAAHPNVKRGVAGQGSTGETIYYYTIGTGDRAIYFQAQQHANEPSGRDALLTLMREWAQRTDQPFLNYLGQVTIVLIPTARPDTLDLRNTVNDVNPNRDNIALTQSEVRAYHSVLKAFQPEVIIDVHEGRNINNQYATSKTLNPNIDPTLQSLSADLENRVKGAIEGAGYSWEPYQGWNIYGAEYFTNAAALRNSVSLLLESKRRDGVTADMNTRYTTQIVAINTIIEWHMGRLGAVGAAVDNAVRPDTVVLASGTSPTGPILSNPPTEYILTQEQLDTLSAHIDLYGLDVRFADGVAYLEGGPISDYLVNPISPEKVVSGEPFWGRRVQRGDEKDAPYPRYYFHSDQGLKRATIVIPTTEP